MAEQLVKIVQTWVDDETGQTTEKTFTYKDGKLTGEQSQVIAQEANSAAKAEQSEAVEIPHGRLPTDFPSLKVLNDAGIHTYKQLSKYADDYTAISGIGDKTAEKITEAVVVESGE